MPDLSFAIESSAPPARPAAPLAPQEAGQIVLCSRNAAERPELEAFIRDGFRRKHGAEVHSFMPVLIGLRDEAGAIAGVAGYRPAALEPLYLEQYLGEPVEQAIGRRHPLPAVARADVAEIGNFACRDCATAMTMVNVLAEFLLDQHHRWVVFTATRTVRGIMRHLGLGLAEIGRADRARVTAAGDHWGTYYSTDPRVMLGYVPSWHGARDRTWSI